MFSGSSYSELAISQAAEGPISITGLQGVAAVGSVTITGDANVSVTGITATGAVGSVTITGIANVSVTGTEATGEVGTAVASADANATVTGVSAEASTPTGGSAFTADGNAQLSTAQAKFGPSSLLLDGTDDFVTSDDNIDLSSGDFTVDMWIRPTSVTGYKGLWESGSSSLLRAYLIADKVRLSVGPSTIIFTSTTGVVANDWTMVSIEREGNNHRLYINGTLEETASNANRPDDGVFSVGKNGFGDFNGYIDELRLSSVARYEGTSFTEPTSNYAVDSNTTALLHFDGANGSTDIVNEADRGVTVTGTANVSPDGIAATGEVGDVTVTTIANVTVTGVEGTATVGDAEATGDANYLAPSFRLVGRIGVVQTSVQVNVTVTGVSASGEVGGVKSTIWNPIDPSQSTTWTEIAA